MQLTPAVLRNCSAILMTVGTHCGQILQRAIRTKGIHNFLKVVLKFPGVELVFVMRPPGMEKFFPARAKVHTEMSHSTQRLIQCLIRLRIKETRLFTRGGSEMAELFMMLQKLGNRFVAHFLTPFVLV